MKIDNVYRLKGMVSPKGDVSLNVVEGFSETRGRCIRVLVVNAKTTKEIARIKFERTTIKQLKSFLSAFGFANLDLQFEIPNKEVEMLNIQIEKLHKENEQLKEYKRKVEQAYEALK